MKMTSEQLADRITATTARNTQISARQARLALLEAGLLTQIDSIMDTLEEPLRSQVQIEWEYSTTLKRTWPSVVALTTALGMSDAEVDALWIHAATL